MNLPLKAFTFARTAHAGHRRKYTGEPYVSHLGEVAGMVAAAASPLATFPLFSSGPNLRDICIATAWLHDCVEDVGVQPSTLVLEFGDKVAAGVMLLSDLETGNRAERKKASRERLAQAPGWVQTIKVADLISNTGSIVQHDPAFARIYLEEKVLLLAVLTNANPVLLAAALAQVSEARAQLGMDQ